MGDTWFYKLLVSVETFCFYILFQTFIKLFLNAKSTVIVNTSICAVYCLVLSLHFGILSLFIIIRCMKLNLDDKMHP